MCHDYGDFQLVPAPVAGLAFLGAACFEVAAAAAAAIFLVRRRPRPALATLVVGAVGGVVYLIALLGLSAISRERVAARGEQKFFCEVDCHVAYSVAEVERRKVIAGHPARGTYEVVTVRVFFDPESTSPSRPPDVPLTQNARSVRIVDAGGQEFGVDPAGQGALESETGVQAPLTRTLTPGESYLTKLVFDLPATASAPRLLITSGDWPTHLLLGHENSFLHAKTSFAL